MHTTTRTPTRQGHRWRCLRDSRLEVDVDLDRAQPIVVETDIDALTRALERLAGSGGFALRLYGEAGPNADAQLIAEDCGYELGAALADALGPAASSIIFGSAGEASPADGLPAGLVMNFFESFTRALGARIAVETGTDTSQDRRDPFAAAGRAIRAAALGRESFCRP